MALIKALMIDVDGVLVCGRPSDGKPWASNIEDDLGLSVADLQREFFTPHWNEIVLGRAVLADHLKPTLAKIAPHLSYDDFIAYWLENDARLNLELLEELRQQREAGKRVYLATNQEHIRAAHLVDTLGLGRHCDGIYYSAALGSRKPDQAFFGQVTDLSGLQADQLLLIDDTPENIVAARVCGWNAIRWQEGSSLTAALAELELEDVKDR
ncbi:HAD-IA family hydrolase [Neorhizobium galegae]|uniref:HAD-IA family hydrolase n=1 Tax=Neorhizobium galegae TaxID=399 RepID=UPI0021012A97|nr:HAD-IA family hydrolase [Neorhizobium galegae]MCQ1574950.1 HAD-IA family hydrolase [Neorhizobium galegae]MCQ1837524.1 HAD-IA family hydrolase [Neorhizobium galegae]UIY31749.1 HAD-IA family hydrolase [Neorhizobium galegae]